MYRDIVKSMSYKILIKGTIVLSLYFKYFLILLKKNGTVFLPWLLINQARFTFKQFINKLMKSIGAFILRKTRLAKKVVTFAIVLKYIFLIQCFG